VLEISRVDLDHVAAVRFSVEADLSILVRVMEVPLLTFYEPLLRT